MGSFLAVPRDGSGDTITASAYAAGTPLGDGGFESFLELTERVRPDFDPQEVSLVGAARAIRFDTVGDDGRPITTIVGEAPDGSWAIWEYTAAEPDPSVVGFLLDGRIGFGEVPFEASLPDPGAAATSVPATE